MLRRTHFVAFLFAALASYAGAQTCYNHAGMRGLDAGITSPSQLVLEVTHGNSTTLAYLASNQWVTLVSLGASVPQPIPGFLPLCFPGPSRALCAIHGEPLGYGWFIRVAVPPGLAGWQVTLQMVGFDPQSLCINTTNARSVVIH